MRLVRWIVVSLGIAAFARWLQRKGKKAAVIEEEPLEDPAEELRRKLAESRAESPSESPEPTPVAPDVPAPEPAAPDVPAPEPSEISVDERRADVHAKGRATLTDMTTPGED